MLAPSCPRPPAPTWPWLAALLLVLCRPVSAAELVSVPVTLEYPVLRHLLVSQLFNTPDGSREVVNDPQECNRIVLSNPQVAAEGDDLQIQADVRSELGVNLFGNCVDLIKWQGGVAFLGRPAVQPGGRSLRVEPLRTWLIGKDGHPILSGRLWDAANRRLLDFFGSFVMDLAPHLQALGALLPEVLPGQQTAQLQAAVDSIGLADLQVAPPSLELSLQFQVEEVPAVVAPEAELTPAEREAFAARWQMMDALLAGAVKHYAAATQLEELRGSLLDILLDSRYRLRDVLSEPESAASDAVQTWFIESWHSLVPVVRSIAREQNGQEQLLWFTAVTAADALYALNRLGSTVGLEISVAGLRRLARLIGAGDVDRLLRYDEEVDPQLQELLQGEIGAAEADLSMLELRFSFFSQAHAETGNWERIREWLPMKGELGSYLPKVETLLNVSANGNLKRHGLAAGYQSLYRKLVLATAWQESCWRQFEVRNKRIEPIVSSSGDIGLMQVNERVWRGFYDLQKLRWDIDYNGATGSEILLSYLLRYALKRGEHQQPGGLNNLARASYSAYNGGPGQVTRYRNPRAAAEHRRIDDLFWEKYRQVDAGKARNVARCLGEELP